MINEYQIAIIKTLEMFERIPVFYCLFIAIPSPLFGISGQG